VRNKNWHIKTQETITYVPKPPLPYIYTGREHWHRINTVDLCKKMRHAYESNKEDKQEHLEYIKKTMSYEAVAQNIKQLLEK